MLRRALAFACLVTLAWSSAASAATWRRLKTDNFVFVGDAPEGQIRSIAEELERFRSVMMLVLPNASPVSPVPTVVFVFQTDRAFQPYQPRFEGRRVDLAGYFQSGEDVNYLAVNGEFGASGLRTILHEYTHFLIGNSFGVVPVWLNEGLAEFYQTITESQGGKAAIVGTAPLAHLELLRQSTLIPLSELMSVDGSSSMYNEGIRRGIFYAQSWALTHYLTLGNPIRTQQFQRYLSLSRQSGASNEAFQTVFGADSGVIERELREYVQRFAFPAIQFQFTGKVSNKITTRAQVLTEGDAQGYLGDMVTRQNRLEDARALLEKAIAAEPRAARPVASLGKLELRARRLDEAIGLLDQASTLARDEAGFASALGRALIDRAADTATDAALRTETLRRARTALDRAVMLEPDTAQALALLGYVELALNENLARSVALLKQAATLAPVRENYRLMLASALAASRDYDGASDVLGRLLARGSRAEVRDEAREGLARLAGLRQASTRPTVAPVVADTGLPATTAPTPIPAAAPGPAPASPAAAPPPASAAGPRLAPTRVIFDLRQAGPGEAQVRGMFRAVECSAGTILLVVEANGRTLRFETRQLASVAFITFRADAPGGVDCGLLGKAFPAIITFRANTGAGSAPSDGTVVAVELVPDDFNQ
ncbi:MAG: tetratricopeptide repeat protein [Vicinamibacterales bacterium]